MWRNLKDSAGKSHPHGGQSLRAHVELLRAPPTLQSIYATRFLPQDWQASPPSTILIFSTRKQHR